MVNALFNGLVKFFNIILRALLGPILILLDNAIPTLTPIVNAIVLMFSIGSQCLGFIIDLLCIPWWAWSFLCLTFVTCNIMKFNAHIIKLSIKWWSAIH